MARLPRWKQQTPAHPVAISFSAWFMEPGHAAYYATYSSLRFMEFGQRTTGRSCYGLMKVANFEIGLLLPSEDVGSPSRYPRFFGQAQTPSGNETKLRAS